MLRLSPAERDELAELFPRSRSRRSAALRSCWPETASPECRRLVRLGIEGPYLKLENLQLIGSFKPRRALNAIGNAPPGGAGGTAS